MASGSQNMTTYNARTVIGSNSAASPAGALLLSGEDRADDATGDTWIFLDSVGGTDTPWGIKHDQVNNKIHIYGNNIDSIWTRMNTGDTYILGKVGIGYDPETSENSYKLYVNGTSFFNDHMYLTAAKHIYMSYNSTNYNILHNHNNGNISLNAAGHGLYMAYQNTTFVNWMNGRMQLKDGCLSIFPNNGSYREGIRIHATGNWSDITLCGNDNTGDTGTSANSWFIGNNNGNFYISRNGSSSSSSAILSCVSNVWSWNGTANGNISGNAATATSTTRLARIADNTTGTDTNGFSTNGLNVRWYSATGKISGQPTQYGFLFTVATGESSNELHQLWAEQANGSLYHRGTNGSSHASPPSFKTILDSSNYTSYTVTKTGSGASGTWGISITGSAGSVAWGNVGSKPATATRWPTWSEVTGKPSTFAPSSHTHSYLPLSGGDMTGSIRQKMTSVTRGAKPSANQYRTYEWIDNGGKRVAQVEYGMITNGESRLHLYVLGNNNTSTGDEYGGIVIYKNVGVSGNTLATYNANNGRFTASSVANAIWNDIAESRRSNIQEPGYVIIPSNDNIAKKTIARLQPACRITSDTYGYLLGDEDNEHVPVAIAGRVLAYPYKDKSEYKIGDAVCSAPGGTIDVMTREEIMMYPDRIIGIVNEIPDYDIWEPSREGGGANPYIQTVVSGQTLDKRLCRLVA